MPSIREMERIDPMAPGTVVGGTPVGVTAEYSNEEIMAMAFPKQEPIENAAAYSDDEVMHAAGVIAPEPVDIPMGSEAYTDEEVLQMAGIAPEAAPEALIPSVPEVGGPAVSTIAPEPVERLEPLSGIERPFAEGELEPIEPIKISPADVGMVFSQGALNTLDAAVGVAEGAGRLAIAGAKFMPALARGAGELVTEFAHKGRITPEGLAFATDEFNKVMEFGQAPPLTQMGETVERVGAAPFETFSEITQPLVLKGLEHGGVEGTPEELEKSAEFITNLLFIPAAGAIKGGVKAAPAAVKGAKRAVQETREVVAEQKAIKERIAERAKAVEAEVPEPIAPERVAEAPVAEAPTLQKPAPTLERAPEIVAKEVPVLKAAKKPQAPRIEKVKDVEVSPEFKESAKKLRQEEVPAKDVESIIASEEGVINLERLSGESSGRSKAAMELVRQRRKGIDILELEAAEFRRDLKFGGPKLKEIKGIKAKVEAKLAGPEQRRKFSKAEREAITLLRQGIRDPEVLKKIGRENVIELVKKPSKEMLAAVKKVGDWFDKGFEFLKDNPGGEGLNYLDNYVTQIWDIPKNKRAGAVGGFKTDNPFTKGRKIPSIEEGIKLGLKPKTLDIVEILDIYDKHRISTHFNRKMVDTLSDLKFYDETTGKIDTLTKRSDLAPEDWILIDHPALKRRKAVGGFKEGETLKFTSDRIPLKVHPEIANELKVVFGKGLELDVPVLQKGLNAVLIANAIAKKGQLSLSLFHGAPLFESAASSGTLLKSWGLLNPVKAYKALRFGRFEIFEKMEVAKDAIEHGQSFGALSDVQRGLIDGALSAMEHRTRNIPGLKHLTRGIEKGNRLWDAGLWDYIHNTLKLYGYEAQVLAEMKRLQKTKGQAATIKDITKTKRTIATFVNDSFGGQNWDIRPVLGHPKMRQLMQLTFLSPDWTVSTLRQAGAVPKGIGEYIAKGDSVRIRRAGFFWAKSVLYFNIIAQSVNYQNTKKEYGEGRLTYDNPPGKKLDIFIGRNPDGSERYLRTGKQFREVMEWGEKPIQKFGSKMSPVAREGIRQLTKHDPGSGFPTKFAREPLWSKESLNERGISLISMPIPFSLRSYVSGRPRNLMFTWSTSRGLTRSRTRNLFMEALEREDQEAVEKLYVSALQNNLDADALLKQAKSKIKSNLTYDNKKVAKKIFTEYRQMKNDSERLGLLATYRKRKIMTPEIEKQFDRMLETQEKVTVQQKRLKFLEEVSDRRYWQNLAAMASTTRAKEFFRKWEASTEAERKNLEEMAGQVPGFRNARFDTILKNLKKRKEKKRLRLIKREKGK